MEYKPKLWLQIGAKDTGKSRFTLEFVVQMYQAQRVPCLVLDIAQQKDYQNFVNVPLEEIPNFNQLAKRAKSPFFKCQTTDVEAFVTVVNEFVRNTLIVMEDVSAHFKGSISRMKQDFILGNRNKGNDVLFNVHFIEATAESLWLNADMLILRKTVEQINRPSQKTRVPHLIIKARKEIESENDRRVILNDAGRRVYPAYRIIDLDRGEIL
jgi:hypothetical protein